MRVFIQHNKEVQCIDPNTYCAYDGFTELGYEVIPYTSMSLVTEERSKLDVVHGHISQVILALHGLGVHRPEPLDYPEQLRSFLGREFRTGTMADARTESNWPLFTKPLKDHKYFTGCVYREFRDMISTSGVPAELEVYLFDPVVFRSEYRVFVHNGFILGSRHYYGDWKIQIDPNVVESALEAYTECPVAFSMDFGVTTDGRTLLVEVNDFYSLGAYGLPSIFYAQAIADRWKEIVSGPMPEMIMGGDE